MSQKNKAKIKVGVSSCLLGERVRWNGDHKKDLFVQGILGQFFNWVPCCPEVDVGMGIPREPVRLVGKSDSPRMIGRESGKDWTAIMNRYSKNKVKELTREDLCGYIFQRKSPTCGMERVPIYKTSGEQAYQGRGLFAAAFMERFPLVPAEEEGRLHDDNIRENFIVRVFSFYRLQNLFRNFSRKGLVDFHTAHKYLLLAHSPKHASALGKLVADVKKIPVKELKEKYAGGFMEALCRHATVKKNVNVLQHMMGFLKEHLSPEEKQDILATIDDYHKGLIPLVVPVTLIGHYVRKFKIPYLLNQVYLNPNPKELMLRNHV